MRFFLIALSLSLLSGCLSRPVHTNTTAFFVEPYPLQGSISVVSAEKTINNSLEFASYKRKFEAALSTAGYSIEGDPTKADYIALVAYGIDSGETTAISTPIWGQTGGGTTTTSGTVRGASGSANYYGKSYTVPTYGVVGSVTGSATSYNRAIAIDIVEAQSLKNGVPKNIYEGRVKSKGSCSVIVGVFDEMLEAMFTGFPGENGRNRKQRVTYNGNC